MNLVDERYKAICTTSDGNEKVMMTGINPLLESLEAIIKTKELKRIHYKKHEKKNEKKKSPKSKN